MQAECLVAAACGGQYDWRNPHLALVLQGGARDGASVYRPYATPPCPLSPLPSLPTTHQKLFSSRLTVALNTGERLRMAAMAAERAGGVGSGSARRRRDRQVPRLPPPRATHGAGGAGGGPPSQCTAHGACGWRSRERRQGTRRTTAQGHRCPSSLSSLSSLPPHTPPPPRARPE